MTELYDKFVELANEIRSDARYMPHPYPDVVAAVVNVLFKGEQYIISAWSDDPQYPKGEGIALLSYDAKSIERLLADPSERAAALDAAIEKLRAVSGLPEAEDDDEPEER